MREHFLAFPRLGSGRDDVFLSRNAPLHLDAIVRPRRVFQHHYGVGPVRNCSSGHDRDGLPVIKRGDFRGCSSGFDFPHNLHRCTGLLKVRGPNRVSVSGCSGKWWKISIRVNGFGQHSTRRIEQAK
jgi:hypothetical protein